MLEELMVKVAEHFGTNGVKWLKDRLLQGKHGDDQMAEASVLVNGDRQADYGTPRENYLGIAKVWSGILAPILKRDITPEEAALLMVGLKLQRQAMKHKRDNLVDAHGYLLVYAHILEESKRAENPDLIPASERWPDGAPT